MRPEWKIARVITCPTLATLKMLKVCVFRTLMVSGQFHAERWVVPGNIFKIRIVSKESTTDEAHRTIRFQASQTELDWPQLSLFLATFHKLVVSSELLKRKQDNTTQAGNCRPCHIKTSPFLQSFLDVSRFHRRGTTMSGCQLEKSPHSGLHNLSTENFASWFTTLRKEACSNPQPNYCVGMFASKCLLVFHADAIQVTYGGTIPTNTNEKSMTNACHVGLAIPGINFWQIAWWQIGQLGHLGRHFKGITSAMMRPSIPCQELHQIFATNHPPKKQIASHPRHMVMFTDSPKATNWSKVSLHCAWARRTAVLRASKIGGVRAGTDCG